MSLPVLSQVAGITRRLRWTIASSPVSSHFTVSPPKLYAPLKTPGLSVRVVKNLRPGLRVVKRIALGVIPTMIAPIRLELVAANT